MFIRVFEAFAGYGSQAMALRRLKYNFPDFDYKVVGISEIDKYALQAYQAVHGTRTHDLFVTNEMLYRLSYCGLRMILYHSCYC